LILNSRQIIPFTVNPLCSWQKQQPLNQRVQGSSPCAPTKLSSVFCDVTKDSNGPPECTQCVPAGGRLRFYKVGEDGHVFGLQVERSFDDDATAIARAAA
jgi:hypothetical protein